MGRAIVRAAALRALGAVGLIIVSTAVVGQIPREKSLEQRPPENVYRGDLVSFPGQWNFQLGRACIILVSDKELIAMEDPDKKLNLTLTFTKQEGSLRSVCEQAKAAGNRTLIVAFDHFFSQYRPGQEGPRKLMPDSEEYIRRIAAVSRFAHGYGLGLELSLLSPLEIGPGYARQTGEAGQWLHYRKGYRDAKSGAYSVQLWQQREWVNNKGPIAVADAGVRVFAFKETPVRGTPYRVVNPADIVDVTGSARVQQIDKSAVKKPARRIRIYGSGGSERADLNRVLVVQVYRTPEMDYFSDRALPYLKGLVDRYADAGVRLNALYADEMHIQQDWGYFGHHDNGEFAMRYVSPGLARQFAAAYGAEYGDLAKYMIYMAYGQEDWSNDTHAKEGVMHVFGDSPEEIRRTALFRSRYYRLLQDGVVDLFSAAKRHAEVRMGHQLESRAHATWAESPTIDEWRSGAENMFSHAYEYTSNFIWSNTVHQAASACHDYFKWGDFLTGNGNDHAECGWSDRNYVGLALAAGTGILNEAPLSYGAHWGMPDDLSRRRAALASVYGAAGSPLDGIVQGMVHRDVAVLMLYPLDLVAVEERFGSWMTQYGYANPITSAKLLEMGKVVNGGIEIAGRRFTTLVALFEPFPSERLLEMMAAFVRSGGRVVWSGPPPVLTAEGKPALPGWQGLFGVDYTPTAGDGRLAPGRVVQFAGSLASVPAQVVLTDFIVDRLYPVRPHAGVETVATAKGDVVGTRRTDGAGSATFLGFRPRDDQSASLGYESRTWFETLSALGAYPATGKIDGVNDNTEHVSRTSEYLTCRFPNGTVAIAPHFRDVEESWKGGFARNPAEDAEALKGVKLPSEAITLRDFAVNGHRVTYSGTGSMEFRVDAVGRLIGFHGKDADRISVDGRETVFADRAGTEVAWAPVPAERRTPGGAVIQAICHGACTLQIPVGDVTGPLAVYAEGPTPGSRGDVAKSSLANGVLTITVDAAHSGRWLYCAPAQR